MLKLIGFWAGVSISVLVLLSFTDDATVSELRETGTRLREHGAALIAEIRAPQTRPTPDSAPPASPEEATATGSGEPASPPLGPAPLIVRKSEEGIAHWPAANESGSAARELAATESGLPERGWHGLWHPFRSEISATRFAERLARMTGREYRVQRLSPWAYQVEFVSLDDADRVATLQDIEQATGLRLVEGQR